jgi:hypothetical protein
MESFLTSAGYGALILFGFLEACCVPISSEITFGFAGVLAGEGRLNVVAVIIIGRRRLVAGSRTCDFGIRQDLFLGLRREPVGRDSFHPITRRWRLSRHETNRCCTAGMTVKSTLWFYAFDRATANKFPASSLRPVYAKASPGS